MRLPYRSPLGSCQGIGVKPKVGFTLAEVAVTIVIVGIALVFVLQGLSQAKMTSYYTANRKIARQLAMGTLSEISAGLYWEDLQGNDDRLIGSYAEEGYERFEYEVLFGEEDDFLMSPQGLDSTRPDGSFDSWARDPDSDRDGIPDSQERSASNSSSTDEEEEEAEEPYEVVRIQVMFPDVGLPETNNTIMLERWIPWEQVYGKDEEDDETASDSSADSNSEGVF